MLTQGYRSIGVLQPTGDRTRAAGTDAAAVDLPQTDHLGRRPTHEYFVSRIKGVA